MHLSPPLVLLSLAALLASCGTDPTKQTDTGAAAFVGEGSSPSVSGHVEHFIEGCCTEKYSFEAHYLGDGSLQGSFNVRDLFLNEAGNATGAEKDFATGRVTCFTVEADGKTARMGGVVEGGNHPELVGREAVWTVRDNGEGEAEPRDEASDLIFGIPPQVNAAQRHCTIGFSPGAFNVFREIARGNVQVRP